MNNTHEYGFEGRMRELFMKGYDLGVSIQMPRWAMDKEELKDLEDAFNNLLSPKEGGEGDNGTKV